LRKQLEAFHGHIDPKAVDFAWPHLSEDDPYIRFAARVAIEWQPVATWQERALAESEPNRAAIALIALCRCGDKSLQPRIVRKLNQLLDSSSTHTALLPILRGYELCFIRMGAPSSDVASQIPKRRDLPEFAVPARDVSAARISAFAEPGREDDPASFDGDA
jgi:hypothetical protein